MDILSIAHFLNGFLMVAIPVVLAIVLTRFWKLSWRYWLIGASIFIISQVGHIPFNIMMTSLLNRTSLTDWPKNALNIFNLTFLGLSAGIFEEFSRYAMFRWWMRDGRTWRKAILAGAGHGGAEAIILGVIVFLTFFQLSAYRNLDLTGLFPPEQLELARQQVSAYWSLPWYTVLMGPLERFLTIPLHIALSVVVVQSLIRKQFYWVLLAVIYHASVTFCVLLVAQNFGAALSELTLGVFAVINLLIIQRLWQPEPVLFVQSSIMPNGNVGTKMPEPNSIGSEDLDNSKYQ
jgi:uncharacterized membrane protein YhfC